ncbi:glycoside hydrolase family protein [Campylobacter jejuni]|uniref:glycoside hydrolase family protein n=1 Tax=Campylobacter jejuni TaxID=197 RepID=UPI0027EF82B3|nr:glycoside hydrolase family protein [Campylobacter jejuni]
MGTNAFSKSTLVKKLNANDNRAAADQFDVWVNAGGKRMQGLVNRRAKEKALFLS